MYDVALDELEECLSMSKTPEQELEHKELTKQLETYLKTLSEQDQVIFVRRYWFANSDLMQDGATSHVCPAHPGTL